MRSIRPHVNHDRLVARSLGAVLAALLVLVMTGGGLGAIPALATPATPVQLPQQVSSKPGLNWGLKDSWRTYIGTGVEFSAGAARNADGTYFFPEARTSYDPATKTTKATFTGTVRFTAYCAHDAHGKTFCPLDSTLANPQIEISEEQQTLSFEVESFSRDDPGTPGSTPHDFGRIVLASLGAQDAKVETSSATTRWTGITAAVADDTAGNALSYAVGTRLDDVSFTHSGPGGKPNLGEHFDRPAVPGYKNGPIFMHEQEGYGSAAPSHAYISADGSTAFWFDFFGTGTPRFQALNAKTMKPHGPPPAITTNEGHRIPEWATTFDSSRNTFYFVDSPPWTDDGPGPDVIKAAAWNSRTAQFDLSTVLTMDRDQPVESLTSLPSSGRLLAMGGEFSKAIVIDPGTKKVREVDLPDPANIASMPEGASLIGLYSAFHKAALADDSVVVVSTSTVQTDRGVQQLPAVRIKIDPASDRADVSVVPKSSEPGVARLYDTVTANADRTRAYLSSKEPKMQSFKLDGDELVPQGSTRELEGLTSTNSVTGASDGTVYVLDGRSKTMAIYDDAGKLVTTHSVPELQESFGQTTRAAITSDGALLAPVLRGSTHWGVQRVERVGTTPSFTVAPQDARVQLSARESARTVELTAAVTGDPGPSVQWQTRQPGGQFTDIEGATGATLRMDASLTTDGVQYRVVATNAAGRVASETATVTVLSPPVIETPPANMTVSAGEDASFSVNSAGTEPMTTSWEMLRGGHWTAVRAGGPFSIVGSQLNISSPGADMNGTQFRAVVSNEFGTVRSTPGTLQVIAAGAPGSPGAGGPTTYNGVVFEWTGGAEWQAKPPNGSAANYFSAGVSDGTQRTYAAKSDGVEIVQRDRGGASRPASWGTRGAHTSSETSQVIRLTKGTAKISSNGPSTIEWKGAFSVNFYDGLVPFTVTNPVLTVHQDGTGSLTGDLRGYAGDMADPHRPKVPAPPKAKATIARFSGVNIDTERGFTVTPAYQGVQVATPGGQTPQVRSGSGWGAWPQSFVDFHFGTGLAGYFYSTGGSFDPAKAPAPFAVGFSGATVPAPPAPERVRDTDRPGSTPIAPTVYYPGGPGGGGGAAGADEQGVAGELAWGVKTSFRSYITGPIAKGRVDLSGGARFDGSAYRFGQTSTTWTRESGTGATQYTGGMRFYGHRGILDLAMSDLSVRIDSPSKGALLARINGSAPREIGALNLAAAKRDYPTGGVAYSGVPVTLTADGSRLFSYQDSVFYQPGTVMDPLSFIVGTTANANSLAGGGGAGTRTITGDGANDGGAGPASSEASTEGIPLDEQALKEITGCDVSDASLNWGFKESFRSYISGSIANGKWETTDGATYTTPLFGWSRGTGRYDATNGKGQVGFTGQIRFTGHKGLLNTTVSNPRIRFVDQNKAYLILDVAGLTMEDALDGKTDPVVAKGIPFATLDLSKGAVDVSEDGKTITASKVPAAMTAEGYRTFPNYPVGTAFDPVDFTMTLDGSKCTEGVKTSAGSDTSEEEAAVAAAGSGGGSDDGDGAGGSGDNDGAMAGIATPWLVAGGIAVLLLGAGAGFGASRASMRSKLAAATAGSAGAGAAGAGSGAGSPGAAT